MARARNPSHITPLVIIGGMVLAIIVFVAGVLLVAYQGAQDDVAELEETVAGLNASGAELQTVVAGLEQSTEELQGANDELQGENAKLAEQLSNTEAELFAATSTTTTTTTRVRTHAIEMYYDLIGRNGYTISGGTCEGRSFWSALTENHQMVLSDGSGNALGTAILGKGTPYTASEGEAIGADHDESFCRFVFTFFSVPGDREFYTVSDNSDFGSLTFSRSDFILGEPGILLDS